MPTTTIIMAYTLYVYIYKYIYIYERAVENIWQMGHI